MGYNFRKPIPVMHVVASLDIGGLESVVVNLMKKHDRSKFKPAVCCLLGKGALGSIIENLGVDVIELQKRRGIDYLTVYKLATILRKRKILILHTHNINPHIHGSLAGEIAGVPININTKHGAEIPFRRRISRVFWDKVIVRSTDRIVAVSEDAKNALIRIAGIDPNKVVTIANGIDIEEHSKEIDIREKKREIGILDEDFIIGNVARLSGEKDHNNLLEAFFIVLQKFPNIKLVLVGDGPLRRELEDKAQRLGIKERTLFSGFRRDVPELLKTFDVFVLSSITEGTSMTILEAMAAGLPVVATNVGGNPEIVVNEKTGIIVPPKDPPALAEAIIRIMSDRNLAEAMGAAGRERVKKLYSSDRMVREYEELYQNILEKKVFHKGNNRGIQHENLQAL